MKASDLLGRPVRTTGGHVLGIVTDLRCVLDGPVHGVLCAPRVTALVVSPRHVGSMLGYNRYEQQGPWLVRAVIRRLHQGQRVIPWSDVDASGPAIVVHAPPRAAG